MTAADVIDRHCLSGHSHCTNRYLRATGDAAMKEPNDEREADAPKWDDSVRTGAKNKLEFQPSKYATDSTQISLSSRVVVSAFHQHLIL